MAIPIASAITREPKTEIPRQRGADGLNFFEGGGGITP